jgi:hypothetical protein
MEYENKLISLRTWLIVDYGIVLAYRSTYYILLHPTSLKTNPIGR